MSFRNKSMAFTKAMNSSVLVSLRKQFYCCSRDSSPIRGGMIALSSTLPQKITPLTAEAVSKLQVRLKHTTVEPLYRDTSLTRTIPATQGSM